jgi:putative transposase
MPAIQRVWQANMQVYGAEKVWRQLARQGSAVARCTVERLMRRLGLRGVMRGKVVKTTISDSRAPRPLDRVNRQFRAQAELAVRGLRDRCVRPTHRGLAGQQRTDFVLDALEQALYDRQPERDGSLICHSGRGSQ